MKLHSYDTFSKHQRGCRKRQINGGNDLLVNKRVVLGSGAIDVNHVPLDEGDRDYDSEAEPEIVLVPLVAWQIYVLEKSYVVVHCHVLGLLRM
jgi:hypothetical protein